MTDVALGCAPIVLLWAAASLFAWLTTPARRGIARRRWRDLRRPGAPAARGLVDLSHDAAARLLAVRVGAATRGIAYLLLVVAVLAVDPLPLSLGMLAAAIWIFNRWMYPAGAAYGLAAGTFARAFSRAAWAYSHPTGHRAKPWRIAGITSAQTLQLFGVTAILAAGLPLAYGSDVLATGIPGVSLRGTGLAWWQLGAIYAVVGYLLAAAGIAVERRVRRRTMRAGTAVLPRPGDGEPPSVFLRPFGAEALRLPVHPGMRRDGLLQVLPRHSDPLEDVATWLLWTRGDVVAIADPRGARPATLGAAHHRLPPELDWQQVVLGLLDRAPAIVLVPGVSDGVAWELEQVTRRPGLAAKTLLLNPEPQREDQTDFLRAIGLPRSVVGRPGVGKKVIGAVADGDGRWRLLCSSCAQDVDVEAAVEWFLSTLPGDPAAAALAQVRERQAARSGR